MANLIVTPPREIGRNPINTLTRWRQEAASLPNVETVNKRIAMVSLAKLWSRPQCYTQLLPGKMRFTYRSPCGDPFHRRSFVFYNILALFRRF